MGATPIGASIFDKLFTSTVSRPKTWHNAYVLRTLKNILYVLSGILLRLVLFFGITATVVLIVFGSPATLKTTLQTSNAYSKFVPSLIESSKKNPKPGSNLNLEDPEIVEIFTDSFTGRDLQKKTEAVIDSAYGWLNGQTSSLQFKIDFTKNKRQFARALTDYAFNRLEALPVCKLPPTELNPLTATCKPIAESFSEVKKSYEEQIFVSDTFLKKTILTQDDLPKNINGQSISEQLHFLPTLFTWLKRAPFILVTLILILTADFLLLSQRKRKGLQSLSAIFFGSGISILAFPVIINYVIPYFTKSFQFSLESDGTQKIFSEIIDSMGRLADVLFIILGTIVIIIGFLIYAAERLSRPSTKYHDIEKKSGVAIGLRKPVLSPKNLRKKLNQNNVPIQSSDGARTKKMKAKGKYRTLFKNKEF